MSRTRVGSGFVLASFLLTCGSNACNLTLSITHVAVSLATRVAAVSPTDLADQPLRLLLLLSAQTLVSFYVNPRPRTVTVASSSGSRDSSVETTDARATTSQAGACAVSWKAYSSKDNFIVFLIQFLINSIEIFIYFLLILLQVRALQADIRRQEKAKARVDRTADPCK